MLHVKLSRTWQNLASKIENWPPSSSDLNPIENFGSILKRKLYTVGQQYASKDELWHGILQSAMGIGAEEIQNLAKSVDD